MNEASPIVNRFPQRRAERLLTLVLFGWFSAVLGSNCAAHDFASLQRLKEIEQKVNSVVARNIGTCVAVTDGVGFGSGVIVSADGLVLTAGHVMTGDGPFEIILPTGRTVKAKALGKNLDVDTGMIQITEPGPWPFVELAKLSPVNSPDDPLLGQWLVSIGHSGGWELGRLPPVRTGRVISRKRHQIITDAVLIGGDSGGPLFDLDGRLVAIHSSIGDSVAENRHVTVDIFERDWDQLLAGKSWGELPELNEPGTKRRAGKIGITVDRTTPHAVVKSVNEGSPAAEAGLRPGDVVLRFNRIQVKDGTALIELIKTKNAGEVFPMTISRNGKTIRFEIQLK